MYVHSYWHEFRVRTVCMHISSALIMNYLNVCNVEYINCICTYICVCMYMYVCMYVYIYVCIFPSKRLTDMIVREYHTHTRIHIENHTHTHIHIHTPIDNLYLQGSAYNLAIQDPHTREDESSCYSHCLDVQPLSDGDNEHNRCPLLRHMYTCQNLRCWL
jgi:hypothetical protein